jgi:hypothetical protein
MAKAPTTLPKTTKTYLTGQLALTVFQSWIATHPGQTLEQLIKGFTDAFIVPETDIAALKELLKPKPAVTPTPSVAEKPPVPPQTITRPAPDLLIYRTPYPKWWKDSLNGTINLIAPGSQTIATVTGNLRLYVATIVITVTGAVAITIVFGNAGSSGPIFLGDTGQPMGIVIAMGNSPAPCGGGSLSISATDISGINPSIGGFATCFVEEIEKPT